MVLYCHGQPGSDGIIRHHIEQHRGDKYALNFTPCGREGQSVEAVKSWNHLLTFPESFQEPTQPRARYIPLQCDEKAVPVNGVIGLPEC